MLKPTLWTWLLLLFGAITFLPLMFAQLTMLLKPDSQKASDLMIGKGETWRNNSHFKSAKAFAWADWLVLLPLFVIGGIGVAFGLIWGYYAWLVSGVISVYFSIVFWIMEKEYTYPSCGPLAYYTYYWGFFLYWGILAAVYSALRLGSVV